MLACCPAFFGILAFGLRYFPRVGTLPLKARWLCSSVLITVAILGFGSAAAAQSNHHTELSRAVNSLATAWNNKDAEAIAGLFASDAILIMPTGKETRTRSAIRNRLLEEWSGKLKDSELDHAVESVRIQSNNSAVVKGRYRLRGAKLLGIEKAPEGQFVFRHQKENGRWILQKADLRRTATE